MTGKSIVRSVTLCVATGMLLLAPAWAQQDNIPLTNWPVPTRAGLSLAAADVTPPLPFIGITPCRVVDTRGNGFTGEWGPPNMTANQFRDFTIASRCGIPSGAQAVSFNFTVTEDPGYGFLRVYPAGGSLPVVSTLNWTPYQTVANAAIVPLGTAGKITVNTAASASAVIIDVNGYFADTAATSTNQFAFWSTNPAAAIVGFNFSNSNGAHGVGGYAGGSGVNYGVQGEIGEGAGIGSAGVHGIGKAVTAGKSYAIMGETPDTTGNSAAILGKITGGAAMQGLGGSWVESGIRGEGGQCGVWGFANVYAVFGRAFNTSGLYAGAGVLGYNYSSSTTYGVYGEAGSAGATNNWAVYAAGNFGASGAKSFVEPHPTDAAKVVRFVSLEGPEAGTYFRGKGHIVRGHAIIEVPESFRFVTDEEGLTVQVTPIGRATLSIASYDLDQIVVEGSGDVEFFYLVQGVRKAFKDFQPIEEGDEFMPASADSTMPSYLTEEAKRRLIANGTYNPDGTPNMATAESLGWARQWREREEAARGVRVGPASPSPATETRGQVGEAPPSRQE
jgi:hypothetical protein